MQKNRYHLKVIAALLMVTERLVISNSQMYEFLAFVKDLITVFPQNYAFR